MKVRKSLFSSEGSFHASTNKKVIMSKKPERLTSESHEEQIANLREHHNEVHQR